MTIEKRTFPSDEADKFVLRMPPGMRDQVAAAAKAAGRSMNAEIVARLQQPLGLDASRDIQFLLKKHEQELAEAALDRHILFLMLNQLAFDNRALGNTLRHQKETLPQLIETIAEWDKETEQMLAEAAEMLTESLEEASTRAKTATDRLVATFERRRGTVARAALDRHLASARHLFEEAHEQRAEDGRQVFSTTGYRLAPPFPPGLGPVAEKSSDDLAGRTHDDALRMAALTEKERAGTLTPAEKKERDALAHSLSGSNQRPLAEAEVALPEQLVSGEEKPQADPAPAPVKKNPYAELSRRRRLGK